MIGGLLIWQAVEKFLVPVNRPAGSRWITTATFPADPMYKADVTQHALYRCCTLEERTPEMYPLRKLRMLVDDILQSMSSGFQALYSLRGRLLVAPERLLALV
jgi:hypothetical protein